MASQRNNQPAGQRVGDDVLLDAARECLLDVGFRRTTLTDVARRAGVSRMTLYRRFADMRSMVSDLMTREFGALFAKATATTADAGTERDRLVTGAVAGIRELWADPLLARLLDLDPDLLLPYIVQRVGTTQRLVEQNLRANIEAGQADGSIRTGNAGVISRGVYLTLQSYALSMRPATTGLGPDPAARRLLLDELATSLDGALRPVQRSPVQRSPVQRSPAERGQV